MKFCIFAYDFPHKKTNSFMRAMARIIKEDIVVIAAPYVEIPQPDRLIYWSEKLISTNPKDVAEKLDISYIHCKHELCVPILEEEKPDIGVIAGAQILPKEVIERFPVGVVNFHNGILPINRGLDCLKWAVHDGLPQGVTAHLINERIDAGKCLETEVVSVWPNDGFADISDRLFEAQRKLLKVVVSTYKSDPNRYSHTVDLIGGKPHGRMPPGTEIETLERFLEYKQHYADIRGEWCP